MKVREICRIGLMASLLCIAAPLVIPVGPVPLSLATFAVYLTGAVLGSRRGVIAAAVYLLIGAIGVPVFSGFSGGLQKLVGPTGGYLLGYLPCAAIVGAAAERWGCKRLVCIGAMFVGTAVCYGIGTVWFMMQTGTGIGGAVTACVLPFLPGDAAKIAAASALAVILRKKRI